MAALPASPPVPTETRSRHRPWAVLASGAYRKLWLGVSLSLFGDFFNYIAMAWLVLQLTGSSLALGAVLTVQAVPRGLLMLVGGALADHLSARLTMAASMALRVACAGPLALLVLMHHVEMWELYAFAAVFGVVSAFFYPSQGAILPRIVADEMLEAGNALMNITRQVSVVVGPALAGLMVAALGSGWAFATDALCFAIGAAVILWLPSTPRPATGVAAQRRPGLAGQIGAGIRYAWNDVGIRTALLVIAGIDFAANGAFEVGLPTLAHGRFAAGASGLGILFGAFGLGATAGAAGAGMIRMPVRMGWLIIGIVFWFAICIGLTGIVPTLAPATVVMAICGIATGVINTYGVTWLQRRTLAEMQGRVMSLVMLASVGLTPVSFAFAGAIAQVSPTYLFVGAGVLLLMAAAVAASSRTVRSL